MTPLGVITSYDSLEIGQIQGGILPRKGILMYRELIYQDGGKAKLEGVTERYKGFASGGEDDAKWVE
jgi:hypothetical protein